MIKINCDLCGKTTESLAKAIIEGVQLDVCTECAKFGKVIAIKRPSAKEQVKQIASTFGFTDEPISANDVNKGKTYIWADNIKSFIEMIRLSEIKLISTAHI